MLEDTENWLYEDGEDQPKHVYVEKLQEMRVRPAVLHCKLHWSAIIGAVGRECSSEFHTLNNTLH